MTSAVEVLRRMAMAGSWQVPVPDAFSARPVILTYHGVPEAKDVRGLCRRVFEEHIAFLAKHFSLISPALLDCPPAGGRHPVLLTFDDGFMNHAVRVAPILRRHQAPAIFFVPSRHLTPGKQLWFSYLRMLERYFPGNGFTFRGAFIDMSPARRGSTMARLRHDLLAMQPHPTAMYAAIDNELPRLEDFVDRRVIDDQCAGMTLEQLEELAADPLFSIGGHTVDHPLLPRCDVAEQVRQIAANREWLERMTKRPCRLFAYPGSEYDATIIRQSRTAGFTAAFGGESGRGIDRDFEYERIGVYYPSVAELGVKVRWSRAITRWRKRQVPVDGPRPAVENSHA